MLPSQIPAADPEIVAAGSALADIVAGIKAGQTPVQIGTAALSDLSTAFANIQNAGVDIKKPQNQAFLGWAIAQALEPKV